MMSEMNPGDVSPTRDEVVVLMGKEEPRSQQDPQVATYIPKNDVKKTKETSKSWKILQCVQGFLGGILRENQVK